MLIESPRPAGDKRREYICVCCPTSSSKASWDCANGMLEEEKISKVSIVQEGQGVFHVIAQFSKLDMKIHSCSWLMAGRQSCGGCLSRATCDGVGALTLRLLSRDYLVCNSPYYTKIKCTYGRGIC